MKLVRTFPPILILFLLIIGSTQSSSSATALDQGASARGEANSYSSPVSELNCSTLPSTSARTSIGTPTASPLTMFEVEDITIDPGF